MMLTGLLFWLIGGGLGFILVVVGIGSDDMAFMAVGTFFGIVFTGIGLSFIQQALREKKLIKKVTTEGVRVTGKIIDYQDGFGTVVNGIPPLDLVIDCYYNGEQRKFVVPSGGYSEKKFPLGSSIDIAILGTDIAVIPNSLVI